VALTFDDGPDGRWTPTILDILAGKGARATFFMIGEQVSRFPELARRVVDEGHEVAVHLFSHDRAVADDESAFRGEVERTRQLIEEHTGARPAYLRFPFAYYGSQRPRSVASELALETVHWSFSSLDSRSDAIEIRRRLERSLFPGAIVLLHDGVGANSRLGTSREATVEALSGVLDDCAARKLAPIGLGELLAGAGKEPGR